MLPEEWTAFPDLLILCAILCAHTREGEREPQAAAQAGLWERARGVGSERAEGTHRMQLRRARRCVHEQACAQGFVHSYLSTHGSGQPPEIHYQAKIPCSSWGGCCSRPACRARPAAALHPRHQAQRRGCAGGCPVCSLSRFAKRSAKQAAEPSAPSHSHTFPRRHPVCFPATSCTRTISSQPGPALRGGRGSWAEPDGHTQLEGARLGARTGELPCCRPSVHSRRGGGARLGGQRGDPGTHAHTHTGRHCCRERKLLICWE